MKKMYFFLLPVVFFTLVVSSCKEKDDNPAEKFSTATVEQNKATVEDAGIELVSTMSEMKSIESVDVIINLGDILSSSGSKKGFLSRDTKLITTLETFAAAANGEKKLNDVFNAMASPKELAEDDPESLQEFWDANTGTYTWNPDMNDWDIVLDEGLDKVIFLFPSSDVATTNDATLTIYNYKGIIITTPPDLDYTGDMPLSLNADLKVGSKNLISLTFAATYNSDGIPNMVAADLTIEDYKFEIDITNTSQEASVNYRFLAKNKVVMDMGAGGEGLFTEDNYNTNTHTTTTTHNETYGHSEYILNTVTGMYEEIWVIDGTYSWEETRTQTDFEEILHSAKAHFQLFTIALRGDINVKGLVDEINIINAQFDNHTINSDAADSLSIIQINKFLNLRLVNVTNNQILAKAEAYVKKEIHNDYMDSHVDFRLTFSDGSPIDAETYFNNGFDSFITELNKLISDINSEYELELEPVEYPVED